MPGGQREGQAGMVPALPTCFPFAVSQPTSFPLASPGVAAHAFAGSTALPGILRTGLLASPGAVLVDV